MAYEGSMNATPPETKPTSIVNTFTVAFAAAVLSAATNTILLANTPVVSQARCTVEQGQRYIDQGRYEMAVREFGCVIEGSPTEIEGYRGRIEAQLLLGRYSAALADHARVTANVLP